MLFPSVNQANQPPRQRALKRVKSTTADVGLKNCFGSEVSIGSVCADFSIGLLCK